MRLSLLLMFMTSCSFLKGTPESIVEELVEDFIEEETGINIDFSGSTKEIRK